MPGDPAEGPSPAPSASVPGGPPDDCHWHRHDCHWHWNWLDCRCPPLVLSGPAAILSVFAWYGFHFPN
ncbi:hypothetical protein [Streptomyces sp. NPDC001508]|uniref:hypothetical protein n=1 Tax=Streptomyces sp. NPDC001508 TaxID=3154656 RepID=UPI003330E2D5